ncbi:hypothetical protein [Methylomagnum sp.]
MHDLRDCSAILLGTPIRLVAYAMRASPPPLRGGSLPFTLASIYLIYLVNLGTAYRGLQAVPLLFLLTGWAESYMQLKQTKPALKGEATSSASAAARFGFRRVL